MTFFLFQKGGAPAATCCTLKIFSTQKFFVTIQKKIGVGICGSGRSKYGIFEASSETQMVKVWPPMVRSRKNRPFFGQSRLYNDFGLKTGIGCAYLDPVGVRWWLENARF